MWNTESLAKSTEGPALHWPEYLIEVAGLGTFMVSAAVMTSVLEHPASPVSGFLPDPMVRRVLMGVAMGLTAAALIYSPWGQRSGAHNNPAVTLTFFRLGKISARDAAGYVSAQFLGGVLGIGLAAVVLGQWVGHPAVNYVATIPGTRGAGVAFIAEAGISCVLMLVVLTVSNHARVARFIGVFVAVLIASFITFEAPLSGMSMNPARTLGPDVVGRIWDGVWIYFLAPPLGMLAGAEIFLRTKGHLSIRCAKLHHGNGPCIFCGAGRLRPAA